MNLMALRREMLPLASPELGYPGDGLRLSGRRGSMSP